MKQIVLKTGVVMMLLLFVIGCDIINPPEEVPAYIQIDSIGLSTDVTLEGENTHKIIDAWVFVENQLIGAFELPAVIPVLSTGEQQIDVFGGIAENGILSTRDLYPFYARYREIKEIPAGEVTKIEPVVTYEDQSIFTFVEDFEATNRFGVDLDGDAFTGLEAVNDGARSGFKSGKAILNQDHRSLEFTSNLFYNFGEPGQKVYLEMDYKNNVELDVGIEGQTNGIQNLQYKIVLNEKEEWNKVYISMTEEVGLLDMDEYRIVFRAYLPDGQEEGEIMIDNIKLLRF